MLTWSLLSVLAASSTCPGRIAAEAAARYEQADSKGTLAATASIEACIDGEPGELAEALRWRAQALLAEGNSPAALDAFVLLLTIAPHYQLDPLLSPKLHQLLTEARARVVATGGLPFARLRRAPLDGSSVLVEVYDPHRVARRVLVRFGDPASEVSATGSAGDAQPSRWVASVPLGAAQEVWALVLSDEGAVARTAPASLAELSMPALRPGPPTGDPGPPMSTAAKVGIAAAVAAAVAIVVVAGAVAADRSLGTLDLP
jgi:hypothetical protein